jgi:hypothetical protein
MFYCYKVLNYVHTCDTCYFLCYVYVLVYLQRSYTFLLHVKTNHFCYLYSRVCGYSVLIKYLDTKGACGSIVGWGTMLQARRSPVQVPNEVDFFNLPNPSSRTMALVSTEPLTELSTRNLPGGKKRPECRTDSLATMYELNVWKCGSPNLSQP